MWVFVEFCCKYDLQFGVYLFLVDFYQIEYLEGLYGNLSKVIEWVIFWLVFGWLFQDIIIFRFKVDDYNEYFFNQFFELLIEYGFIYEVWLDGVYLKCKGGQQYDYLVWKELI